ncbi:hypothetical protein N2152v2_009843 [Parachlorella kessleri]
MAEFVGRLIAKQFPGHGKKKFKGRVTAYDPADELAFHIEYDDGDSEDVTREELQTILVSEAANKRKKSSIEPGPQSSSGVPKSKKAATGRGASKKPVAKPAPSEEAPVDGNAAAATGAAAAGVAASAADADAEEEQNNAGTSKQPGPEAAVQDPKGKAAAPAAVPAAAADAAPLAAAPREEKGKAGPSTNRAAAGAALGKLKSPRSDLTAQAVVGSEALQGLITDVVTTTKARALEIVRYRVEEGAPTEVAHVPTEVASEGGQVSGGAVPLRSQAVVCGSLAFISTIFPEEIQKIEGDPQPAEELATEYKRQAQQVLAELDAQLETVGSSKQHLINVTVMLREVDKGSPPFGEVWNQWVNVAALPAMFIFESYMDREALVAVTAQAAVPPQIF